MVCGLELCVIFGMGCLFEVLVGVLVGECLYEFGLFFYVGIGVVEFEE